MAVGRALMTAEDLFNLPEDDMFHELVKGELITLPPPGAKHGFVAGQAFFLIRTHVDAHELGSVFAAETGFKIGRNPDTVRAPDVAFVAAERLPTELPDGYMDLAPDLVVEVVSPSDSARYVQEKVFDWLEAGARVVLVVYPSRQSIAAYRSRTDVRLLGPGDALDLNDVLPGFASPVRSLFS